MDELFKQINAAEYFNNVTAWHGCRNAIYFPLIPPTTSTDRISFNDPKGFRVAQAKAEFTTWGIGNKVVARVAYAPEIKTLFYCDIA